MNVTAIAALLRVRAVLRSHDRETRDELLALQAAALAELRAFALAHSPFYRELHRGLEDAPLEALPVVTKAMLRDRFDNLVTDRDVRLVDVEQYLATVARLGSFPGSLPGRSDGRHDRSARCLPRRPTRVDDDPGLVCPGVRVGGHRCAARGRLAGRRRGRPACASSLTARHRASIPPPALGKAPLVRFHDRGMDGSGHPPDGRGY